MANVKPLTGNDRINLLNTNAYNTLQRIGKGAYIPIIQKAVQATGNTVQPYELFQTISRESSFNPNAKSSTSSAAGLTQMTNNAQKTFGVRNPYDPEQSILGAARYLSKLKSDGITDPVEAQKAYLLGEGGYHRYLRGDNSVAGVGDVAGLVSKWGADSDRLLNGNYDPKAKVGAVINNDRTPNSQPTSGLTGAYTTPDLGDSSPTDSSAGNLISEEYHNKMDELKNKMSQIMGSDDDITKGVF